MSRELTAQEVIKSVWPDWALEEKIGGGTNGAVYKAVRREYGIEIFSAIKVITIPASAAEADSLRTSGMGMDAARSYLQEVVSGCIGEIKVMESLKGAPNVVSIEDFKAIEDADEPRWHILIRMELLTPMHVYTSDRRLTEKDVLRLGIEICTALESCGRKDTIHRDIKPENILVNDYDIFKLGDFGIARRIDGLAVSLSRKRGTPLYMAPEVFSHSHYDARVDYYSLGLVLYYYMNRCRPPFVSVNKQIVTPTDNEEAIARRNGGEPLPAPIDASPALAEVILRACEYDPDRRYQSATEMKRALLRVRDEGAQWEEYDAPAAAPRREPVQQPRGGAIRVSLKKPEDTGAPVQQAQPARPAAQPARPARPAAQQAQPARPAQAARPAAQQAQPVQPARPAAQQAQPARPAQAAQPVRNAAKAEPAENSKTTNVVNTFGDNKMYKKAKRTLGFFIAFVLLCAGVLIAAAVIKAQNSANADSSLPDALAQGVQSDSQGEPDVYPETSGASDEADKAQVLRRAEELADSGRYDFAMAIIKDAQRTALDDPDYAEAWARYSELAGAQDVSAESGEAQTAQSVIQTTRRTAQTAKPADQTTRPVTQTTKPAAQTTKPAAQTTMPAAQTTTPAAQPQEVFLERLSVRTLPHKTEYTEGEELDVDGLTLTAEYSDGSEKIVSSGFSYWRLDNALGEQLVKVAYEGMTALFYITVSPAQVRDIEWYGVSAGSTYDSAFELTGFLLQCMFTCDSSSTQGYTAYDSIGLEKGHSVIYVESFDYLYFSFWLPNDPSLEGWHTVTLCHDGTEDEVSYYIEYLGDYSDIVGTSQPCDGLGWEVTEWYAA